MSTVVEINDIEELEHYYLAWNLLLPQTRGASFFHTLDWLKIYWRHYGARQKLRVLLVFSGGEPVGIVPLVVIRESTRLGNLRVLTYPLHDWGSFFSQIGPHPTATLLAAMQHIRSTPRDWDLLDFRWINHTHDRGRTLTAMDCAGIPGQASLWKENAIVNTSGRWEDYFASRSAKFRQNLRRLDRRAKLQGSVAFQRFRPLGAACGEGDPHFDLYDTCVDLAKRSWQGASATGTTLSHNSVADFLRQCHQAAARLGMVEINLLRIDGRPAAFLYNYQYAGYVFGLRSGYDPAFAKTGAADLVLKESLAASFACDDHTYDMGPDWFAAKKKWITETAVSRRATHYPLTAPRAQLLRLKHWYSRRRRSEGKSTAV